MENIRPAFCIKCDKWVLAGKGVAKGKQGIMVVYCMDCIGGIKDGKQNELRKRRSNRKN